MEDLTDEYRSNHYRNDEVAISKLENTGNSINEAAIYRVLNDVNANGGDDESGEDSNNDDSEDSSDFKEACPGIFIPKMKAEQTKKSSAKKTTSKSI
jgi:hypothetical protein